MKNKALTVSLIAILLFSFLSVASAAVKCPRCHGTGKITEEQTCPSCGGTGVAESGNNVILKRIYAGASGTTAHPATSVSGVFHNELADVGVYGVATAEVRSATATYTNSSEETYFPPGEDVTVTVIVDGIKYEPYLSCTIALSGGGNAECPECGGTGVVTVTIDCPDCGGTGFVDALPGLPGLSGDETNFLIIGGVAVGVAAALVLAVVLMVKRKRVTEASLRRLSPSEFQNWVLQRLSGRVSSQKDSMMGIDGYTVEGYPIQVKQVGDVGRNAIDSFASVMGRSRARTGVIVAFSFDNGTFEGIVRAKLHYGFEIKTVTVNELIQSSGRPY
jgi:hypothetical protein